MVDNGIACALGVIVYALSLAFVLTWFRRFELSVHSATRRRHDQDPQERSCATPPFSGTRRRPEAGIAGPGRSRRDRRTRLMVEPVVAPLASAASE